MQHLKLPLVIVIFFSLIWHSANGATYRPLSIHEQLSESSGIVVGVYNSKTYKKLPDGMVVTEASFSVDLMAGLTSDQIKNQKDFRVQYPGGNWQGINYAIEGMPTFKPGNRYMLFLVNNGYGIGITSQSLGVYQVENFELSNPYFVSTVFPDHAELGNVSIDKINLAAADMFGNALISPNLEKQVFQGNSSNKSDEIGRRPASISNEEVEESLDRENSMTTLWLVLLFATIGVITIFASKQKR